jgi:Uma2 family endonuclease
MATAIVTENTDAPTLGDVLERLGGVPADRVLLRPVPGTATEDNIVELMGRKGHLYELVDGVVVEKPMGAYEDLVGSLLVQILGSFVRDRDLGIVLGPSASLRLAAGSVRLPDVCFISWSKLPSRRFPRSPIAPLVPDLAVEVLSPTNTHAEMQRKLQDYFASGVRLVWYIDPELKSATIYDAPDSYKTIHLADSLEGGEVLPGFSVPLAELFTIEREPG